MGKVENDVGADSGSWIVTSLRRVASSEGKVVRLVVFCFSLLSQPKNLVDCGRILCILFERLACIGVVVDKCSTH